MALTPLTPEPIVPRNPKPLRNAIVTEEGKVAAEVASNLPGDGELKRLVAAMAGKVAKDILLGVLPFKSAGEASKVVRDFAAVAKDLEGFDDVAEQLLSVESESDRKDGLLAFREKALKAKRES